MTPLGSPAPPFSLPDTAAPGGSRIVSLDDFRDPSGGGGVLLVMFICNHCPFVKHIRAELAKLGAEYQKKGVAVVAINPNDVEKYPDDSPAKMTEEVKAAGYTFPYLYDATQEVAKAYRAACTPDFFVFDKARKLIYRGQLDDSRPSKDPEKQIPVTGRDLRAALDAALAGRPPVKDQKPSIGCNIKWKPGNEPDYFKS
jgi:thiol-disulfide isomerase/thioredoxin